MLALAGWLAGLSGWSYFPALLLPAALLARQVATLDIHDPAPACACSSANREVGLAVALASCSGACERPEASSAPNRHRPAVDGAGDPAAPRDRDHPDLAGDRGLACARGLEPPFWAFAWPGSQALARHILDNPAHVAGRRVLDFAAGCGLAAIACARAGAASVEAAEIDPLAAGRDPAERRG